MDDEKNQLQVFLIAHRPWKSQTARFPHSHRPGEAVEKWKAKSRLPTFPLLCDTYIDTKKGGPANRATVTSPGSPAKHFSRMQRNVTFFEFFLSRRLPTSY